MGKSTTEKYGSVGREDLLKLHAEDIVLVDDPKHALYDPRVHRPVDEALVLNILELGVLHPVVVKFNEETGKVECVIGRGRVKAVREANKRLKDAGDAGDVDGGKEILIPARAQGRDPDKVSAMKIGAENALREDLSVLQKAEHAYRLATVFELTHDKIAVSMGVTPKTIENWLKILDCDPKIQKAIDQGIIPATLAVDLSKLSREDQKARLDQMVAEGTTKGLAAKQTARGGGKPGAGGLGKKKKKTADSNGESEKKPEKGPRFMGKMYLNAIYDYLTEETNVSELGPAQAREYAVAYQIFSFVLGYQKTMQGDYLREISTVAKKLRKRKQEIASKKDDAE